MADRLVWTSSSVPRTAEEVCDLMAQAQDWMELSPLYKRLEQAMGWQSAYVLWENSCKLLDERGLSVGPDNKPMEDSA